MSQHRVFIYGTLLQGYGNNRLLTESRFLGPAITESRFTMLGLGGFPGIVADGETSIRGELYEVDDATLRNLDRLEGHPSFYERTPLLVLPDEVDDAAQIGEWQPAEAYVLPKEWLARNSRVIESGSWRTRGVEAGANR